jgi:putative exosortase-associated protein (TIGR04073 family)
MRVHDLAESPVYKEKAGGMIGRGLLNVVTCFVDPMVQTVNETKAGPPLVGTVRGLATGLTCGVLRLGSGAVDVISFWVPGFNGFPVSDAYDNCLGTPGGGASNVSVPGTGGWESAPIAEPMPADMPAAQTEPAKKYYKK